MQYLSIHTPAAGTAGPPSVAHMAEMGRLIEDMTKQGKLLATGALGRRDTGAFSVHLKDGAYTVDEKPTAAWMLGGGFAILKAGSRAEAIEDTKRFLAVVGGGVSEVIELAFGIRE